LERLFKLLLPLLLVEQCLSPEATTGQECWSKIIYCVLSILGRQRCWVSFNLLLVETISHKFSLVFGVPCGTRTHVPGRHGSRAAGHQHHRCPQLQKGRAVAGRAGTVRPSLSIHFWRRRAFQSTNTPPSETGLWLPSKNTLRVDQAIAVLLEEISCVIDNTQGLTRESFVHAKRFYLVCWQGIMHRRRFDSPSVSRLGMLLCV
jgi:hypothetical protein